MRLPNDHVSTACCYSEQELRLHTVVIWIGNAFCDAFWKPASSKRNFSLFLPQLCQYGSKSTSRGHLRHVCITDPRFLIMTWDVPSVPIRETNGTKSYFGWSMATDGKNKISAVCVVVSSINTRSLFEDNIRLKRKLHWRAIRSRPFRSRGAKNGKNKISSWVSQASIRQHTAKTK